jgi:hypothetical protein
MWARDIRKHTDIHCHNPLCQWAVLIWNAPGEGQGKDRMWSFATHRDAILYRDGHPDGPTEPWMPTSGAIQQEKKGEA